MINNHSEIVNNDISLQDIVTIFLKSWKKILIGGIAGGILGGSYSLFIPPVYQATANIQVGKVANIDIEAPSVVVEKMKMPTYYSMNTFVSCNLNNSAEPGRILINKLNPTLSKSTPIISINYKDKSADQAKKCLESVLADIRKNQDEKASQLIENKKNLLANLNKELKAMNQFVTSIGLDSSNSNSTPSSSFFNNLITTRNTILLLQKDIGSLEIELKEPQTKSTHLTTPIHAPNLRVEPNRTSIVLSSIIAGCLLVLFFLLGRKTWLKLYKFESN